MTEELPTSLAEELSLSTGKSMTAAEFLAEFGMTFDEAARKVLEINGQANKRWSDVLNKIEANADRKTIKQMTAWRIELQRRKKFAEDF